MKARAKGQGLTEYVLVVGVVALLLVASVTRLKDALNTALCGNMPFERQD